MPKREPLYPHIPKGGEPKAKIEVSERDKAKLRNLLSKVEVQIRDEERAAREYYSLATSLDALSAESGIDLISFSNAMREIAHDEEKHQSRLQEWMDYYAPEGTLVI